MSKNLPLFFYFSGYCVFFFVPSFSSIVIFGEFYDQKLTYSSLELNSTKFILYSNIIITIFFFVQTHFSKKFTRNMIAHQRIPIFDLILYFSVIFYTLKSARLILYVFSNGFLSFYTDYSESFAINLLWYISKFYIIFYIWWFDVLKVNRLFKYLFIVNLLVLGAFGFRNEALFFAVNIFLRLFITKPPGSLVNKKIIGGLIVLGMILQGIALLRSVDYRTQEIGDVSWRGLLIGALMSQNAVPTNAGLAFENKEYLFEKGRISVFSPILDPVDRLISGHNGAHNVEYLEVTSNIDHHLTYYLNKKYWLDGGGMGSSLVFESYAVFWYFGLLIVLTLNAYLIENIMKFNKYLRLFLCMNLFHFFFMWRSSYIISLEVIIGFLMVLVIWLGFTSSNLTGKGKKLKQS